MPEIDYLKPRSVRLVRELLDKKGPVVIDTLASQFGVSPRTIRYDLADVKKWVAKRGMKLVAQPRVGIRLNGNPEKVVSDLKKAQKPSYQAPLFVADRRNALVLAMLQTPHPIPLTALAESLYVSRSTVKSDIVVLRETLPGKGLQMKHKAGVGHFIIGSEYFIRKGIAALLFERLKGGLEFVPWADMIPGEKTVSPGCLERMWRMGGSFRVETRMCLEPHSFREFVALLAVTVGRVEKGHSMDMSPERLAKLSRTKEYTACMSLAGRIKESESVSLSPGDIGFLAVFLVETGQAWNIEVEDQADKELAIRCLKVFISEMDKYLSENIEQDKELKTGLLSHFERMVMRKQLGVMVSNPLTDEMQKQYPAVFSACIQAGNVLGDMLGENLQEDEIAYLSMHVCAALERQKKRPKRILICATGLSSGKLLAARLSSKFKDVEILDVIPITQAIQYSGLSNVDLIVSSVSFKAPTEVLVVSPLFSDSDIAALETQGLSKVRSVPDNETGFRSLTGRLLDTITQHISIENKNDLAESIYETLKSHRFFGPLHESLTQQFNVKDMASKIFERVRHLIPSLSESHGEVETHIRLGLERILSGVEINADLHSTFKDVDSLKEIIKDVGKSAGKVFASHEVEFLASWICRPEEHMIAVMEAAVLASTELGLTRNQMSLLEKLVMAACRGAQKESVHIGRDVLFDLSLHVASTVLLRDETDIMKELANLAMDELTPGMLRAGKAMAEEMSAVLQREFEPWEETYLAVYAGSAVLRQATGA